MLFGVENVEEFLKNTCSREQFAKHLLFIESSEPLTISERRIKTRLMIDKQLIELEIGLDNVQGLYMKIRNQANVTIIFTNAVLEDC